MHAKTLYAIILALSLAPACALSKVPVSGTDFIWSEGTQTDTLFSISQAMHATFSPDSKSIAYTTLEPYIYRPIAQNIAILNIDTGLSRTLFRPKECDSCSHSTLSPDGKYLAYLKGWDVVLADSKTGATIRKLKTESDHLLYNTGTEYDPLLFSPDGKYIALRENIGSQHMMTLWDAETGERTSILEKYKIRQPSSTFWVALFSPDSKYLLFSSYQEHTTLFETATGKKLHKFKNSTKSPNDAIGFSHDSKYAFVRIESKKDMWEKWDIENDKLAGLGGGTAYSGLINSISLMPDDRIVYTLAAYFYSCGQLILIDDRKIGEGIHEDVRHLAVSSDGRHMISASASDDSSFIRLWDANSGKALHTYSFNAKRKVMALSISPDGRYILVYDNDQQSEVLIARPSFSDTLKRTMASKKRPQMPEKLEQEQYESKADFAKRVAKTKADYEAALASYNAAVKAGPTATDLSWAFGNTHGAPVVASVHYDTESGIFTFNVKGDGELPVEGGHEYVFSLKEPIPNEKAREFADALKKAAPEVTFRLNKGILHTVAAAVTIDGKNYSAVPSAEAEQAERQIVDMGTPSGEPELSITESSDNKELAEQARKVAQLRREKAEKERLEKLKAEAAALEGRGLKTYSSDVDAPNFKGAERADDYALVIGVEGYGLKDLPKADYAERDADAMKNYFLALGLPERNIKLLKGSDATYAKLKGYLESWLPKNTKENSRVYFYFSGHGSPEPTSGSAYLLPWDGDPAFLESSAYPLTTLYGNLGKLKAKSVVVMLDSCFSGAGGHSVMQKGARPLVVTKSASALPGNMTLLSAASGDEITGGLEEQGHGRFTYYLLKGIYSGMDDSAKLCGYMTPEVQNAAARSNTSQTPVCRGVKADRLR